MAWPRRWASSSRANVESPTMLIDWIGSIWKAHVNGMASGILEKAASRKRSPVGRERGDQVTRNQAGRNGDHIEAQIEIGMSRIAGDPGQRGTDDPLLLMHRHRLAGEVEVAARLDLDEGDRSAAAGDQVNLADRAAEAAGEDAVALARQEGCRHGLGDDALAVGPAAPVAVGGRPAHGSSPGSARGRSASARS